MLQLEQSRLPHRHSTRKLVPLTKDRAGSLDFCFCKILLLSPFLFMELSRKSAKTKSLSVFGCRVIPGSFRRGLRFIEAANEALMRELPERRNDMNLN